MKISIYKENKGAAEVACKQHLPMKLNYKIPAPHNLMHFVTNVLRKKMMMILLVVGLRKMGVSQEDE